MVRSWMEIIAPSPSHFPTTNWKTHAWSEHENKLFEDALAYVDTNSPGRWEKVAELLPGKTAADVMSHYRDLIEDVTRIEAGLVPFPGYSSSVLLDWEGGGHGNGYEGIKAGFCGGGRRIGGRPSDHERKKGVPWTEEEHRMFLMGLKKYGKGDWRNISRNFVVSRTPTQVASHAQKYFIRLNSGSKDKRRSSIHDITTNNLQDARPSSPSNQPSGLSMQSTSSTTPGTTEQFSNVVDSIQRNEAVNMFTPSAHANPFAQAHYGIDSYRLKSQAQHLHRSAIHNSMVGHGQHTMLFQMH